MSDFYEPEMADPGEGDLFGALERVALGARRYRAEMASGGTGADVLDTDTKPRWEKVIARCDTFADARRIADALNASDGGRQPE